MDIHFKYSHGPYFNLLNESLDCSQEYQQGDQDEKERIQNDRDSKKKTWSKITAEI